MYCYLFFFLSLSSYAILSRVNAKAPQPNKIKNIATILSKDVLGVISPYPTITKRLNKIFL